MKNPGNIIRAAAFLLLLLADATPVPAAHFTAGTQEAKNFGVHEIALKGNSGVANPFDAIVEARFTPPSGVAKAITAKAFYDGDNTWRARVYVSEAGEWKWLVSCATDKTLDGKTGTFRAVESKLRGRLLPHPKNPRQWMTEDGKWFLNLNDTAYFLLCAYDQSGKPVSDDDAKAYLRDDVERGITSIRSFTLIGPKGFLDDGANSLRAWNEAVFEDDARSRLRLERFRVTDQRLRMMLDSFPDVYAQYILFPRGSRYKQDDQMWITFTPGQKERVLRYVIARFAAYPQIVWLVTNDAHYGKDFPNNNAFAREVGACFLKYDPWRHPLSTGHARQVEYAFSGEEWSSYIHLEDSYDLGATKFAKYERFNKPVFLGEDRYEQDHPADRDPSDMRYFQRRLYWAWLLSGGSANYGGRWWVVVPYTQSAQRADPSPWSTAAGGEAGKAKSPVIHAGQLTGLDSVKFIRDYFLARKIELSDFEPDHALAADGDGRKDTLAPRLMRRGWDEFLIYHPNAGADGRHTKADVAKTARLRLDLSKANGSFAVEWYRSLDGEAKDGGSVDGGKVIELTASWTGQDVVVRLIRMTGGK